MSATVYPSVMPWIPLQHFALTKFPSRILMIGAILLIAPTHVLHIQHTVWKHPDARTRVPITIIVIQVSVKIVMRRAASVNLGITLIPMAIQMDFHLFVEKLMIVDVWILMAIMIFVSLNFSEFFDETYSHHTRLHRCTPAGVRCGTGAIF